MRMRPSDRLDTVSKIGRELQSRYTFDDLRSYLAAFKVNAPAELIGNSKWVYVKQVLASAPTSVVALIADDLDLVPGQTAIRSNIPPANWKATTQLRLFISHISAHKDKATRLKSCLAPYAISGFVAHEDIHPTLEWQHEIERALHTMDAFVAIHTPGFKDSIWTQQEIGFAVGKGVKIISLKMGEDPTGFISKHQALARQKNTAEEVAKEIDQLLADDERTNPRLTDAREAAGLTQEDRIPF